MNECGMTLSPLGDSALVLSLSDEVEESVLARVRAAADGLRKASVSGVIDVVPAFATVTVYYDVARIETYAAFESRVVEIVTRAAGSAPRPVASRLVEVAVCYGGEFGPDLEDVAVHAGLKVRDVIGLHHEAEYRVHAIGFVPGFAYLGGLPARLHVPRRPTPRAVIAPGSVGIGGAQTGVYPMATPGGWNIIGRTPLPMFDVTAAPPARLHTGDRVRFRPITPREFAAWK